MAKQSSQAAALVSEDGLYEVPVLDWNTAKKMKRPLPPRSDLTAVDLDVAVEQEINNGAECDTSDEYKTLRRTVSNRMAARKSRMKRHSTVAEKETRSGELTVVVDSLRPQVEAFEEKKKLLEVEKAQLQAALIAGANRSIAAAKLTEELRREIARLKENLAVLYDIHFYQQIPQNADQPQPYSMDFYQKAPVFVGGDDDEVEVYDQYFNLDGGEGMNLNPDNLC